MGSGRISWSSKFADGIFPEFSKISVQNYSWKNNRPIVTGYFQKADGLALLRNANQSNCAILMHS